MGHQKIYDEQGHFHFLTFKTYRNIPVLAEEKNKLVVIENLKFYRNKYAAKIAGYVIMPDHLHLLMAIDEGKKMSDFVRDFKKGVALQIIRQQTKSSLKPLEKDKPEKGNYRHAVWQKKYFDFNVFSAEKFIEKLNYIHNNPLTKELVEEPARWEYSSYRNYYLGDNSIIAIDLVRL